MSNSKELIANLSGPKEVRELAKKELVNINENDLVLLAQQSELCHKGCWESAAEVLNQIGFPRIKSVLPYLMEWFQDINWPGVGTIVKTLRTTNPIELIPYIEDAAKRSIAENDDCWAFGLVSLVRELDSLHLVDKELYNKLLQLSEIDS